ncbi:glycerol-3-phosphate acyltransferase [Psittacicella gerlachiana]|nr:glycerol-3-phosphate acyltransferase [Psittacicella gerlachiana]
MLTFFAIITFYLVGSFPNGKLLSRVFRLNVHELLERRPNYLMFRSLKSTWLLISLAISDFAKGIIPLYLGYKLGFTSLELSYLVIALLLGHYYSVFNYFRGRLGIVVCIALYTTLGWSVMFIAIILWFLAYFLFGYRVIANVFVATFVPFYAYWLNPTYMIPVVTLSCMIILKHVGLLIRTRYGYYLPDCNGLLQRLARDKDFLI